MKLIAAMALLYVFAPLSLWAYPEFIGYGYSTCLTCHYNGHGNGPINDYGRAVWSAEIAGRAFAGNKTDDDLANNSGFLGAPDNLPWWFRPGVKARQIQVMKDPGSRHYTTQNILMQADINAAVFFDKKENLAFIGSYGYAPEPASLQNQTGVKKQPTQISREHYLRWHSTKSLWVYAGFLDKVYGIRTVNHTAYSRAKTGLAQNDQSDSLILHYIQPAWEISLDGFVGNLSQDADLRQKGFSTLFDYEIAQNWRLGTSLLSSSNKYVKNDRWAIHSRAGLGEGGSLLWELGLIKDSPKAAGLDSTLGYYIYSEGMQKIVRGYHLFLSGQAYKKDMVASQADVFKASAGLLAFPMARTEVRIELESGRQVSTDTVTDDNWILLTQLHLSL